MNRLTARPSTPQVSVVIPVFDAAHLVAETIDHVSSAFDAAGVEGEVIIVDDGSTDDVVGAAARARGAAWVELVRQEHRGIAAARNTGISVSRAPLVAMLDAGDRWTPAMFEVVLPLALGHDAPPIVQGRVIEESSDATSEPFDGMNLGSAWFRRDVFETVGPFDEQLIRLVDYDWFLRAHDRRVPKLRTNDAVLRWRRHLGGLTAAAPRPDPLLVRVQRAAIRRRRSGLRELPLGFPTLEAYLGPRSATGVPQPGPTVLHAGSDALRRLDDRPVDDNATIVAFVCTRNELVRLPALLAHHRVAGVEAFFVVDNGSTDGSDAWLLEQPDVHVWSATGSFAASQFGGQWVMALLERFGAGRWCLVVDADELFVAAYEPTVPGGEPGGPWLRRLCAALDDEGTEALLSVMIDLYPRGPVSEATYRAGEDPLAYCRWFDRKVWSHRTDQHHGYVGHDSYFGGVRQRVFGANGGDALDATYFTLNKVPLFRFRPDLAIAPSFHWINGATMSAGRGALLHWKYTAAFIDGASCEAQRAEHWNAASQYRRYASALERDPALTLFDPEASLEYRGVDQLIELGVVAPVPVGCAGRVG